MRKLVLLCSLIVVLGSVTACRSSRNTDPSFDPALTNLSPEEAFARAEQLFEQKKWNQARRHYTYVYQTSPNDPLGRKSLLRVADTYFERGDPVNLVEAQYKYRDFINRYPGADSADYAMLQIARVSFKQMYKPDRDQARTREAIEKFDQMIAAYPNSPLRKEAEALRQQALDRLARHEHIVAKFYLGRGNAQAAIIRLNKLVDTFPNYNERDSMFFDLATALERAGRQGEARLYYERVVSEFPQSEFAARSKNKLQSLGS